MSTSGETALEELAAYAEEIGDPSSPAPVVQLFLQSPAISNKRHIIE